MTITSAGALELAKLGLLDLIPASVIEDKSKADPITKCCVCIQAGWFVVQSIARVARNLPLSLVEIHVLAHVCVALLVYFFWFRKPYNALSPLILNRAEVIQMAALYTMFPTVSRKTTPGAKVKCLAKDHLAIPPSGHSPLLDDDEQHANPRQRNKERLQYSPLVAELAKEAVHRVKGRHKHFQFFQSDNGLIGHRQSYFVTELSDFHQNPGNKPSNIETLAQKEPQKFELMYQLLPSHNASIGIIKCTVFERENYINERSRDWTFGIYYAQAPLTECLPKHLSERLTTAFVDPHRGYSENDALTMLNGETGESLQNMPTPNVLRLNRSKFRALIAEGIDIQYGKRLSSITSPSNGDPVVAKFEDGSSAKGSILIGTDGANSKVRELLLGAEKAAQQTLPLMGCGLVERLPADVALKVRAINEIYCVNYHPEGIYAFISLHDVPDPSKRETSKWMCYLTAKKTDVEIPTDDMHIRQHWDQCAEKFAEPIRMAYLSIPQESKIWCHQLSEWRTLPWDNHDGRLTLAGDAAHPMTYHRGQGLNNAIQDAFNLCQALEEHCKHGKGLSEVISVYEKEVQERGRAAVISSGENSIMIHEWEQLKRSPIFTMGMKALPQKGK
ncbi:MAG: hypothetical protein Q9222_000082 [Ikaeria aurantiellina]